MLFQNDENFILETDGYKFSHWLGYPANLEELYSYLEARGGPYPKSVFFGLQYLLQRHLEGFRFTPEDIREAQDFVNEYYGVPGAFNRAGWEQMHDVYGGVLPLRICAVPEGTPVDIHNVLMTIENTDPRFAFITNYVETTLSRVWAPTTVATQSWYMRQDMEQAKATTGGVADVSNMLVDFGYRGVSSRETAAICGAAHLVNFQASDTIAAILLARKHYGCHMAAYGVRAAEHSTITSWSQAAEADAYLNMLRQFPTGLVAVVSDSYDIFNAVENIWGDELRPFVEMRDGVLIIRPDSGDPVEVVVNRLLPTLAGIFGYQVNEQGYKTLSPKVRILQGDGIGPSSLKDILSAMVYAGWCSDNVAFGSGGRLLQTVNRDTMEFAIKASEAVVSGQARNVRKSPSTDLKKHSKAGRFALIQTSSGRWETFVQGTEWEGTNKLRPVFENGKMLVVDTLSDIRKRAGWEFGA